MAFVLFIVSACSDNTIVMPPNEDSNSVNTTSQANDSTEIKTATLTRDGDNIYGSVANSVTEFSFLNEISVGENSTWVVSTDQYGMYGIATKRVPLYAGDNVFYIHVTNDQANDIKTYTVRLHRNYIYTVKFDTDDGSVIDNQYFEEGTEYYVTKPTTEPAKNCYLFGGWDYDFSEPVQNNLTINAIWNIDPEMMNFEFISTKTYCTITGLKDNSLTTVSIPNYVTSIGSNAFYNCSGLTNITIPDSVTSIGDRAFYNCGSLTSITIPDSVTSIGYQAFSGCSGLTSITIPDSITSIGYSEFFGCSSLTSITIPDSVTSIGDYAFSGCSGLTSITIGGSVTSIGERAFYDCSSLTSVTIGGSVTSIGVSAFYNCSSLTSINIPDSVTSIGKRAFSGCSGLTSVTFKNTSGWYVSTGSSATSGTNVTVTNATQNATYLTSTYRNYYWKRKTA